jgi:hypothetical protein
MLVFVSWDLFCPLAESNPSPRTVNEQIIAISLIETKKTCSGYVTGFPNLC